MQPRPSFDRSLLIPIAIGIVSILGIRWILMTSDLGKSFIHPTAIPSSVISLETGTRTPSPLVTITQDGTSPTATETSPDSYPGPLAKSLPSTSTLMTESLPTPSTTPTSLPTPSATPTPDFMPLLAGKHDDTDPNIVYDLDWTALKNPSTVKAYKGTIHASSDAGSAASFRFTGKGFWLGYKRGMSFGTVTVLVDDQSYSFNEQDFALVWSSPKLSPGDHFVRIIHESGESINLDYIVIVD